MSIPRIFKRRWFQLLLIIIIISAGYFWWQLANTQEEDIQTHTVAITNIQQYITASGQVTAKDITTLRFQAPGRLAWVGVEEGDRVTQWQAIASLDQQELQKRFQQAAVDAEIAQNTFENTIIDYDYAYTSYENGEYQTRGDEDGYYKRILENNHLSRDKTQLTREIAEISKQYAHLYSPINGIVVQATDLHPGVITSPTTQYVIVDPKTLRFTAKVEESEIGQIYPGLTATILLDAYPEDPQTSTVQDIDFQSTTTTSGTTAYQVHFPINLTDNIRLDMNGDVDILIQEKQNVLTVPIEAVTETEGGKQVTLLQGATTTTQSIETGIETDNEYEVIQGLHAGDIVVLP